MEYQGLVTTSMWLDRNGRSGCLGQGNKSIAPILPLGCSILINSSSKLMERELGILEFFSSFTKFILSENFKLPFENYGYSSQT